MKIINNNEETLDDLVKKARHDPKVKELTQYHGARYPGDDVLVFASQGKLHLMFKYKINELNKTKKEKVTGFYIFDQKLCIYDTQVISACNHKFDVYFSEIGPDGPIIRSKFGKTFDFNRKIEALCPIGDVLLGADTEGTIWALGSGMRIIETNHPITAMYSPDPSTLYYAGFSIFCSVDDKQEKITERTHAVKAIASYNGRIIDASLHGIYDTIENEKITDMPIDALISMPYEIALAVFPIHVQADYLLK